MKVFPRFLGIFLFSFVLSSSSASASASNTLEIIKKRGYLIVAMLESDDPPFSMKQADGTEIGVNMDLSKDLAHALGVGLRVIKNAKTYDDVIRQVENGEADLAVSNLSITLDRAQRVNYSHEYMTVRKAILLSNKVFAALRESKEDTLRSFFDAGNTLGVIKGSSYVSFAKSEFPKAKIVLYDRWSDLIVDLDKGLIAAGFWDKFEVDKVIAFHPKGSLYYKGISLNIPPDQFAIALKKGDQDFLNWINIFLNLRIERLEVRDLLHKYAQYLKSEKFNELES